MNLRFLVFTALNFIFSLASAQEKCATVAFNEQFEKDKLQSKEKFENWLQQKVQERHVQGRVNALGETVYQIPTVVHIVHNGEEEGIGGNIPYDQIISQINILNEDFRRLNRDQTDTPLDFLPVAADVKIEFVLARRDPEGLPTSGIVRVKGNQPKFQFSAPEVLSVNSYWPAEQYFNLWVANLSDTWLGFAKFPVSNLPGMDDDPNLNREVDGVYIDYRYFGMGYNADDFSKGRTATHEIGHWLGLRHIWGDGGCLLDDFCGDTPLQESSSSSNKTCNDLSGQRSCGSVDMYQNYMDYTSDVCMNLFTLCQADRMRTVLENSPRRKDLLSSKGAIAPAQVANDLGIKSIQSPAFGNCSASIVPEIEIRNYGTNVITTFSIDLIIDDMLIESQVFTENLSFLQTLFVKFSPVDNLGKETTFSFKITQVNGVMDGNAENDCQWLSTFFTTAQTLPFIEEFNEASITSPLLWSRANSAQGNFAWSYATAPNLTLANEAAVLNYFGATVESFGQQDYLISPAFDLADFTAVDMKFKYAYSGYPGNYSDALTVIVSTDCGKTFPIENILFQKIGAELATTSLSSSFFEPTGPGDWREMELNLSDYVAYSEVVFAFVGNNGGGNNIYIDDFFIYSSSTFDHDIGITQVTGLPLITCKDGFTAEVNVRNFGKQTLDSFTLTYAYGTVSESLNFSDLNLLSGKATIVSIESTLEVEGLSQINFEVSNPNNQQDEDLANNLMVYNIIRDQEVQEIPIREKFSKTLENSDWHFVRREDAHAWKVVEFLDGTRREYAVSVPCYDLTLLNTEDWLISPVLDFSNTSSASMTFDVSYANKLGRNDQLELRASRDCGQNFDFVLYDKRGGELAVKQSETAWVPGEAEDWRSEFVPLNDLAGFSEVRLALVVTNQNGNNLYLDNVELYVTDEVPIATSAALLTFPVPAKDHVEIKFNFNIKETVSIRLIGLDGEIMVEKSFPNTLNQIYRIENISHVPSGIYLLQVIGNYTNLSSKLLIHN